VARRRRDALSRNTVDSAHRGPAFFAYSANYLVDADHAIIVDVEATTAIRQAEILAAKRMIERSLEHFDLYPERLIGDSAYGSAEMLNWLVHDRGIEIPVFDKSQRTNSTFSRDDFSYDNATDTYRCPARKTLQHYRRRFAIPRRGIMKDNSMSYRASKSDCQTCHLKPRCCPRAPARKISRSVYEGARDLAREIAKTEAYQTSRRQRKRSRCCSHTSNRILKRDRLRLRGPNGARDEFHLAATAQNLWKLAILVPATPPMPAG
jgi:Transposase DDE domain